MMLRMTCEISFYYGNSHTHTHCRKSSVPSCRGCPETRCFYTETLLHTEAFTHRSFYTQKLSYTDSFTHRRFYTQKLLHTDPFTHRRFFTQTLLHTDTFYTQKFHFTAVFDDQTSFRAKGLLWHTQSQFYFSFWRSNFISCERVAFRAVSLALPRALREK